MNHNTPSDPLEELRSLVERMRALLGEARARYPEDVPPLAAPKLPPLYSFHEETSALTTTTVVEHTTTSFVDEEGDTSDLPNEFATATMGHILITQGKNDEARAVFASVLSRDPTDVEALRGMSLLGDSPTPASTSTTMLDHEQPATEYGSLSVRALSVDPTSLHAHWEIPDGIAPAATPLSLMVLSLRTGLHGDVERIEKRFSPIEKTGNQFVRDLPAGAHHHVAVGYDTDNAFAPVAQAPVVKAPRGVQSPVPAIEVAEVVVPAPERSPVSVTVNSSPLILPGSDLLARAVSSLNAGQTRNPAPVEVFSEAMASWVRQNGNAPSS
jgi:hypothetical protein